MAAYPTGTVAFLFTDIEGSTRRWETRQQAMWAAVERHFELLEAAISAHGGVLFKTVGDAVQAAFPSVPDAIAAAVDGQTALCQTDWGDLGPLRVRMAIHVGEATPRDGDYLAPGLNRLARVLATGYGDQVLLTEAALAAAGPALAGEFTALDLGAHRLRDLLHAEHIYQLSGPGLAAEFPPLKSLDRHPHTLPAQPTALLGREAELAAVRALLQEDGVRLVTLTGPGGTGKTRLAIQIGAELIETFPDGVWFVPLAAITDPDLVIPAIAQPLGVRENPDQPLLTTLQEYLESRSALLVLDNFEQVTAAAPRVAALLAACANLKILTTSREPLRIAGEREFAVSPLTFPTPRQARHHSPAELLGFSAIQLFVERAQSVKSDFALTDANGADIAAICQRLDGLPLAIELAAARVRELPPAQLLGRLENRLKLLTGGNRDLPARQQTLRAAIEWSHDLLNADEQRLFARLSVFAGGCALEAAEAVCAEVGEAALDVLDGVDSLLQKSLLRRIDDPDGEPRFTMLESIREYGLERLEATGEADAVQQSHAAYFLAIAEEAEPNLTGPQQITWLDRLETEHDNFRAALGWAEHPSDAEARLRLAGALWRFWWMRGHLSEGRRWLNRTLAAAAETSPTVRADALSGAGVLAEMQGDYERATQFNEEALKLRRQANDRPGIASSLTNLGSVARIQGAYDRAKASHEQALELWQELGDERGMTSSLYELGRLALNRGDYEAARELLKQCLDLSRTSGDKSAQGSVLESLGMLEFYMGDYEGASANYEESLALWRDLSDSRMIAYSLGQLGEVELHQGKVSHAEALLQEALGYFRVLEDTRGTAFVRRQLGMVALERNDIGQAAELFTESLLLRKRIGETWATLESIEDLAKVAFERGLMAEGLLLLAALEAQRTATGEQLTPSHIALRQRFLAPARGILGEATFVQEWSRGQGFSLEQAVRETLQLESLLAPAFTASGVLPPMS
jgi:predicted ATPase/class 3 adenylate cyclase